jgi:hypothetical protein
VFGEEADGGQPNLLLHRVEGLAGGDDGCEVVYGVECVDGLTVYAADVARVLPGKEKWVFRARFRHAWADVAVHYEPSACAPQPPCWTQLVEWVPTVQEHFAAYPAPRLGCSSGVRGALNVYAGGAGWTPAARGPTLSVPAAGEEVELAVWSELFWSVTNSLDEPDAAAREALHAVALLDLALTYSAHARRAWELFDVEGQVAAAERSLLDTRCLALLHAQSVLRAAQPGEKLRSALAAALRNRAYPTLSVPTSLYGPLFDTYVAHAAAYLGACDSSAGWPWVQLRNKVALALAATLRRVAAREVGRALDVDLPPLAACLYALDWTDEVFPYRFEFWSSWARSAASFRLALLYTTNCKKELVVEELSAERGSVELVERPEGELLLLVVTAPDFERSS